MNNSTGLQSNRANSIIKHSSYLCFIIEFTLVLLVLACFILVVAFLKRIVRVFYNL